MEKQFWQEKWQANDIAFHQQQAHPLLVKHLARLGLPNGARVFVPLCGKSSDMLEIREQGYNVVGLELSELAAAAFFDENGLDAELEREEDFSHFKSQHIEIIGGDFFLASQERIGEFRAVFDRAALVALPVEMRSAYASQLQRLCRPGTQILLITLEYTQGLIKAPPFSVEAAELEQLYGSWCEIELIEKASAEVKGKACYELVYRLRVK